MRIGLSFLVAAATVTRVLAIIKYDDLVLTSIHVKDIEGRPGRVEFSGMIKGRKDVKSVFLKNIVEVRREGWVGNRRPVFEADIVPLKEVKETIKCSHTAKYKIPYKEDGIPLHTDGKPLLCVHGFNIQPGDHLKQCLEAKDKFKHFKLIPVIWHSEGGLRNYFGDRRTNSVGAGKAFKALSQYAGEFPKQALIAHSMGNRVLRAAADAKFKFDNIFMVAADVHGHMFNKDYIEKKSGVERCEDGLILGSMLRTEKAKIYQLYNHRDFALTGSTIFKAGTPRLGSTTLENSKIHDELKGRVEGKDAGSWLKWTRNVMKHSYQWDQEAIDFYDSKFYD